MKFYKRWIGDYMRDTTHLTMTEHGAYAVLLDLYYATGAPLPASHKTLYRMTSCQEDDEKAAIAKVADEFFPVSLEDGLRHNCRADKEIKQTIEYSEEQAAKALKRWHKQ